MPVPKSQDLPELFIPDDSRWASRAAGRGEIRRLARGLYSTNLSEASARLVRRRWYDVAALYFPAAVDRSAAAAGPATDGSLFIDVGRRPINPRPVGLPGLTLRPRSGPGPVAGDVPFAGLRMASPARIALDNLRPSRARASVSRTLRREELEERLDRLARIRGPEALNELRDQARVIAPALDAHAQFVRLDELVGALLGTRDADLRTSAGRARRAGLPYRDEYLAALRALSQNGNPTPLCMLDRAQRWAALMPWTSRDRVLELMNQTNALATPERAAADNLHLRDPSAPYLSQT